MSNGLGSPLCQGALAEQELSPSARANCQTSGFVAAGSPTGDYGLDVHIDTGFLGLSEGTLSSAAQDLVVTPLWMAVVWVVHALVVMLEWCFTIDLLDSASLSLGAGLREMQSSLTEPLLACVLAVASVLTAYNGLVRRRVSEALGHALLAGAMMAGGLWVIVDPTGTVGALGAWANQASLGTLAASASGSPAGAGRTLADSTAALFDAAVEAPWCYLEFGDVAWCRNPDRLDPRLHAAALRIAGEEVAHATCSPSAAALLTCAAPSEAGASVLRHSAQLLRLARSNGAIFLALPANGPQRNSINDEGSLLRTMCQSSEMSSCHGPMAAQAEFRTGSATWKRLGGLLLILAAVLGMVLLFGFVALRLLGAAIFSLLYLLLTPAAVLAPALGEGGRTIFRRWAAQLLGALLAKLLFAFLLGTLLAVLAALAALEAVGWWTQWLLMGAFWWGAFLRRHQALEVAGGAVGLGRGGDPRTPVRRARELLRPTRALAVLAAGRAVGRLSRRPPEADLASAGHRQARERMRDQARQSAWHQHRDGERSAALAKQLQQRLARAHAQHARIQRARTNASARGDSRHAARLGARAQRVREEIELDQARLREHRERRPPGAAADVVGEHARFLDAQARLPAASQRAHGATRRDYAALAGLARLAREDYEQLDPHRQRAARMEVDRALATRREMPRAARDVADLATVPPRREQLRVQRSFEAALRRRVSDGDRTAATAHTGDAARRSRSRRPAESLPGASGRSESTVLRDAREVALRRKRQLGRGHS